MDAATLHYAAPTSLTINRKLIEKKATRRLQTEANHQKKRKGRKLQTKNQNNLGFKPGEAGKRLIRKGNKILKRAAYLLLIS